MMGRQKKEYRRVSGIPVFGSLFVGISLLKFWQSPWLLALGILLILIDSGGLHWFFGTILYHEVLKK
ncbi:MAG: hypothetical protein ACYSUP_08665 [Planctomycetota bacterium]|jgi:hypothetical protein